ncbi:MAG: aminotransferase class V-fold PLP-dependent enzyme, partial [Sphaerochaetaceae bacterium]|nr:aminotransferase class V-fold PLP-dependent enzyme [Sphaerochaetaceae bacterium]
MKTVYLDNNATTEVAKEVLEAMDGVGNAYGNASSMHAFGRESSRLIEQARHQIAKLIGSDDDEIIFTSGGTESDNTVFSIARDLIDQGSERKKIVT